jgi:hypothetical protein
MGLSVFPAPSAASKTRFMTTLTSGTTWTVPTGVTYVNVTLVGGGGGGGCSGGTDINASNGYPGECISSIVTTTPGATISYAIGAGGGGGGWNNTTGASPGGTGGTTTFTGATSATGGNLGRDIDSDRTTTSAKVSWANNGGQAVPSGGGSQVKTAGAGGNGFINIEYWS